MAIVYNQLSITPFHEGVQFSVDLVIGGHYHWVSTRCNASPTIYPLLRRAIGCSQEDQETLFTQFFMEMMAQDLDNAKQKWQHRPVNHDGHIGHDGSDYDGSDVGTGTNPKDASL
jgi:hypothetical protein